MDFKNEILLGIPNELPKVKKYDPSVNHAPIREGVLNQSLKNMEEYICIDSDLIMIFTRDL